MRGNYPRITRAGRPDSSPPRNGSIPPIPAASLASTFDPLQTSRSYLAVRSLSADCWPTAHGGSLFKHEAVKAFSSSLLSSSFISCSCFTDFVASNVSVKHAHVGVISRPAAAALGAAATHWFTDLTRKAVRKALSNASTYSRVSLSFVLGGAEPSCCAIDAEATTALHIASVRSERVWSFPIGQS